MTSSLAIVTPWHNHFEYAEEYWYAVSAGRLSDQADEIIIVDNASDPPLPPSGSMQILRLEENLGFCGGCNAGLHAATTDYVLFLNNDIELRDPNWLSAIRKHLGRHRLIGQLRQGHWTYANGRWHDYIDGWCLAAHRQDLLDLGGWDERLLEPAYYSDNLLTLRAQQAGWQLVDVTVGLRHINNGTAGDNMRAVNEAAVHNRAVWKQATLEEEGVYA